MLKHSMGAVALSLLLSNCAAVEPVSETAADAIAETSYLPVPPIYTPDPSATAMTSALPYGAYAQPDDPNYGPEKGSITFADTDPGPTIAGVLTMKPAVDENGELIDAEAAGISMYMIHWGMEVGAPGVEDNAGAGDLGGDCMGFRDTGHIVMAMADQAGDQMTWKLPAGTVVPEGAVYFVGHTIYGDIHNLNKCTQTPIENLME
ncbi:MAG: hypothetical protein AAF719_12355 [Pseudomonadota bacterium]